MKRSIICIFFALMMISSLYSADTTYSSELTREIQLQGAYDKVVSIEFDEIAAQSQGELSGIPFNIQDQTVQAESGNGRAISRWNIITNTPFTLRVSCDGMFHEDVIEKKKPLNFSLTFTYDLAYYVSGNEESYKGSFTYSTDPESNGDENNVINMIPEDVVPDTNTFIGSVDGLVYFKFNTFSKDIDIDELYPPGNYYADVKVEVITE